MSIAAYAILTRKRQEAAPGTSESTSPPGVKTFLDSLAALVPAEVLLAHAAIIPLATDTTQDDKGQSVTRITEDGTLEVVFIALIIVSAFLYIIAKLPKWKVTDFGRMLIPPFAFIGWTMLQKTTAFDAVAPDLDTPARFAIAIIGAVVLGGLAVALGYAADAETG